MHIKRIELKNFRLLRNIELTIEEKTTVIVGRNNSGKTSLTEFFRRIFSDTSPKFSLEDFPMNVQEDFWTAFICNHNGKEEHEVRTVLPIIEAKITFAYDVNASDLGPLCEFIIDLDINSSEAVVVIRYQLQDGKIPALFDNIDYEPGKDIGKQKKEFFRTIKERVPELYVLNLIALDPTDDTNQKLLDLNKLRFLVQAGFVNAQRGLDDVTNKDRDILGKVLERLLSEATSDNATKGDRLTVKELEDAVLDIQGSIDSNFNEKLNKLLPAISVFGYPGLSDPQLCTETILNVNRLLENNTRIRYANSHGISLPEAYNGLGSRNLIFILFQIFEFFKSYQIKPIAPGIHVIFIEEPEAHLHPQMQEVFIKQISQIAEIFSQTYNSGQPWAVQFIVTTHSTHIANAAPFEAIRYFLNTGCDNQQTKVKDLRSGLGGNPWEQDREFLHKYLTLTKCDLFFADKAMLIEGPTERLLMPKMVEKVDKNIDGDRKLASQYISIIEVGGAFAHHFFKLLDFLEVHTLIITDIDSVKEAEGKKGRIACKVAEGTHTSNACLKTWYRDNAISPAALIEKIDDDKIFNFCRIEYQLPEVGSSVCGRSFEDAFMLANKELFGIQGNNEQEFADEAWEQASKVDKTDFALKYAIENTEWIVPRYIDEGLRWLAACTADSASNKVQSKSDDVAQSKKGEANV